MPNTNEVSKFFEVGHLNIRFVSNRLDLMERIGDWLKDFEIPDDGRNADIFVRLFGYELDQSLPYRVPDQAVPFFENASAKYYEHRGMWIVDFGQTGIMEVDRASNEIAGYVYIQPVLKSLTRFEDYMHPLSELLRQNKLYPHHAAAVSKNGQGLLLLGKSGQGKSTLTVDLVHNGFDFLADDRCFLREDEERMEMIAFYEPFKVFTSNISHISDLGDLEVLETTTRNKKSLNIIDFYPGNKILKSELKGIIFPHWSPGELSRIEPMTAGNAFMTILPLTLVCFDPHTSKAHFDFSGRMVTKVPSAKLILGSDKDNWSKLVSTMLS